jgi:hypothetical protein
MDISSMSIPVALSSCIEDIEFLRVSEASVLDLIKSIERDLIASRQKLAAIVEELVFRIKMKENLESIQTNAARFSISPIARKSLVREDAEKTLESNIEESKQDWGSQMSQEDLKLRNEQEIHDASCNADAVINATDSKPIPLGAFAFDCNDVEHDLFDKSSKSNTKSSKANNKKPQHPVEKVDEKKPQQQAWLNVVHLGKKHPKTKTTVTACSGMQAEKEMLEKSRKEFFTEFEQYSIRTIGTIGKRDLDTTYTMSMDTNKKQEELAKVIISNVYDLLAEEPESFFEMLSSRGISLDQFKRDNFGRQKN